MMNSALMSFETRFQLEKLVLPGEVTTFQAREVATGRLVYLHLVGNPAESARARQILEAVRGLQSGAAAPSPSPILDVGEALGSHYVVTERVEGFAGLPAWLESQGAVLPESSPAPSGGTPSPQAPQAGEFTRMVREMQRSAPPPPVPPPAAPGEFTRMVREAQKQQPAPAPPASGPGEFTLMVKQTGESAAARPPEPFPEAAPPAVGSGGFTKLVPGQAPPAPARPPAAPNRPFTEVVRTPEAPLPPVHNYETFDRFFEAPAALRATTPGPTDSAPLPPAAPYPAAAGTDKPFREAGEFTKLFGRTPASPEQAGAPVYPAPEQPLLDDNTPSKRSFASATPHTLPEKAAAGPSEYSAVIKAGSSREVAPPPQTPTQAAMPPAAAGSPNVVLFVVIGLVAGGLLMAGLFLAFRG